MLRYEVGIVLAASPQDSPCQCISMLTSQWRQPPIQGTGRDPNLTSCSINQSGSYHSWFLSYTVELKFLPCLPDAADCSEMELENNWSWKRPPRSPSPTINPSPPCPLIGCVVQKKTRHRHEKLKISGIIMAKNNCTNIQLCFTCPFLNTYTNLTNKTHSCKGCKNTINLKLFNKKNSGTLLYILSCL